MYNWMETAPELATPVLIQCEGVVDPAMKSSKPTDYMGADVLDAPTLLPEGKAFVLKASEDCVKELTTHLLAKKKKPKEIASFLGKTSLEMGPSFLFMYPQLEEVVLGSFDSNMEAMDRSGWTYRRRSRCSGTSWAGTFSSRSRT